VLCVLVLAASDEKTQSRGLNKVPGGKKFRARIDQAPRKIDRAAFTHAMANTSDSAAARALQAAATSGASGAGACFSRPFLAVARRDRPVAPTKEGFFSDVIADSMRFARPRPF
jgi:hypothetical protein